ncbi:MAG TPA: Asp-tRNA(Asn)/Glu-tRNA(Gln) amidotransferase subunit GatC [Pseudomonadales bacterium]|nr:Asp-tRNA(Asn)/Glu-tRNA(Gln) amidotransferase subunit GatC [Pseudomonadales bacterium]
MPLDDHQVRTVAHLARIAVSEQDITHYTRELSNILGLINQLQDVSTQDIAPLANPLEQSQRLRCDQVTETNQREQYQGCAPLTEQGLYLVPRVIE